MSEKAHKIFEPIRRHDEIWVCATPSSGRKLAEVRIYYHNRDRQQSVEELPDYTRGAGYNPHFSVRVLKIEDTIMPQEEKDHLKQPEIKVAEIVPLKKTENN